MADKLSIGFFWHMHQPEYRDPITGESTLPWVRLHSCCGYNDMIALAYRFPEIGQVINLTPVLLDQLQAYADGSTTDLYLELSRSPTGDLTENQRRFIIANFFQANPDTQIKPYPRYRELWQRYQLLKKTVPKRLLHSQFSDRDILDLQVWFNLAWMGWSARRNAIVQTLFDKGSDFSEAEKNVLLTLQMGLTAEVLRKLTAIENDTASELTFTPFYHPIAPLLCDTNASLVSRPDMPLSKIRFRHPDDTNWHVREGMKKLQQFTGHPPRGMWPAEGSVSSEAMRIFAEAGVEWLVTDEGIVYCSDPPIKERYEIHRPHRLDDHPDGPVIFFRERDISDAIGFRYQKRTPDDAVNELVGRLEAAADHIPQPDEFMLTIALDGENPWGYFPDFGEGFLCTLMERLEQHSRLDVRTMSHYLEQDPPIRMIKRLHSGSWIDSDFHIWIGDPLKNRAWELLTRTRDLLDKKDVSEEIGERIQRHLHIAEGSDWFWWYGEPNRSDNDPEFDRLFRGHLQQIYRLMGIPVPSELFDPIGASSEVESPDHPPSGLIHPVLDGMASSYNEWLSAGLVNRNDDLTVSTGGYNTDDPAQVERLYYGYDRGNFYVRIDFNCSARMMITDACSVKVVIEQPKQVIWRLLGTVEQGEVEGNSVVDHILEASVPLEAITDRLDTVMAFHVALERNMVVKRFPKGRDVRVTVTTNQ